MENPPPQFFRLALGREVRLRSAYLIRCTEVIKDPQTGNIQELRCHYDPLTKGGTTPDGRKVKGTLHWVSEAHGHQVEVRLYDSLFHAPIPEKEASDDWKQRSLQSLEILKEVIAEPSLIQAAAEAHYQFERQGYFCVDRKESQQGRWVFNRTVTLRDSWTKEKAK